MPSADPQSCFDPDKARFPTRVIPQAHIVDLLPVTHAPECIETYRTAMRQGDRFPPVAVLRLGARYFITDGHKRFSAYRTLTAADVLVEQWTMRQWLADQTKQLTNQVRRRVQLLVASRSDPAARAALRRIRVDTIGHWRRIGQSLLVHFSTKDQPHTTALTPSHVFWRLVRECLAFPGRLTAAIASLLLLSATQLALTWSVKLWAEGPLIGDSRMTGPLLTAGVALTLTMVATLFSSRYLLNNINQRVVEGLRNQLQARLLSLRLDVAHAHASGELLSRLFADAGVLSGFVRDVLKRLVGEGVVTIGALALLFYLNWRLATLTILVVPIIVVLLSAASGILRRRSLQTQRALGALTATVNQQLRGLATIKTFQGEAAETARFAREGARYRAAVMRGELWSGLLGSSIWLLTGVVLFGVVAYGSRLVRSGEITPGALVAFCLYLAQTIEPLRRLGDLQTLLQHAIAAATRVYEIIDLDTIETTGGASEARPIRGEIRLESVSFGYRDDQTVLRDLNLHIAAGDQVALVAASGGGKTTLLNLLMRFADPRSGVIRLDGTDLRGLPLATLRRVVCVVAQEPFIFSGSLLDNLRYGSWNAPRSAIEDAVRVAGLEPFVRGLAGGLDADLSEAGHNVSVGQKQRICLARAMVRDPRVLILDEATSALDSDIEEQIFVQAADWLRRRTVLVVAHRLSTVARFDRVILMVDGRIIDDASPSLLRQRSAPFRQLFSEQVRA